jgi:DNA-binding NarL/FixJ family response regulator
MDNIIHEVNEKIFFASKKLTKRELDVLEGIKQGLSNNEIGEKLFISPKTVNQHLKSIYKKMQVESRAKLLAKLFSGKIFR